jgi:radical SAM superfamily enzyme YgiQ (UPF0313 family)
VARVKITFIRPHLFDGRSSDALEPLAFAILAGLTPPDVDVALHDERIEPIPLDDDTDLVAITVETYTARRAYEIADAYRRRRTPVVLGGYHPTLLPDEALQHADAIVAGDAEAVWPAVVDDARHGRLRPVYRADRQPPLEGLAFDRRIFHGKRYPPIASVQFSRGCRFACEFCSIHAFYGSTVRHRPAHEVAAEIDRIGRRQVLIVDDNLFVDRPAAEALFRALIPLKIRWGCQISIDVAADEALLDLMAQSGCLAALIGFESLDRDNLEQMRKPWNLRHGGYADAVRRLHDRGIMVYGSFVFGYDRETRDTIARTVEFAIGSKLFLVNFSVLTPTPGSRLYDRLAREGRLLYDRWWLDTRYRYGDAVYRPIGMTPGELAEACLRARQTFYRYGSIAARLRARVNRHSPAHAALFLGANHVSRRELASKMGHALGSTQPEVTQLSGAGAPAPTIVRH